MEEGSFGDMKLNVLSEPFEGQTYSYDDDVEYNVKELYKHVSGKPVKIPIKELMHNLVGDEASDLDEPIGSPEFLKRAMGTDLNHPIMIYRIDGRKWIIDGNHRLFKANKLGMDSIQAYVFDSLPDSAMVKA